MKANQKFMEADNAVSPVIGVILMVAITVVLAAVVFVLVSDLGDTSENAPAITFNKNSSAGTLTVVRADAATWDEFALNQAAIDGGCVIPTSGDVSAGDVIDCSNGTDPVYSGTVSVTHEPTNSLVYSTTF